MGRITYEKMKKLCLQKSHKHNSHTTAKMGRDENVSMDVLARICSYFKCDISEILEYRDK
ncbi:helix-turn-helix transcriptional regulator [uncultured Peptoniphilus sp.]|uniref:helix-turn-helix domain-containing protein n=1 Tax=uncultured Peptoniphilus sp. TaxID=254354 RepID=UPI00280490EE|nr:helix-turn-helix transcriptional regulator [Peptoniphilus harei]MDU6743873.1 helix-turn-helix transcriptional regulator [Peptoniphilus harei]